MIFRIIRRELHSAFQPVARLAFAADARGPAGRAAVKQSEISLRPGVVKLPVQLRRRFEFIFHFPDDLQCAQTFGARELAEIHAQIIMRGDRICVTRDELAARGDALIGNGRTPGFVRGEVGEIVARAGELPGGIGIIRVRFKLNLRAMKFRLGARGETFIPRVIGENNSAGGEKKNCGGAFPFRGVFVLGIKSCLHVRLFYTGQVRFNWNFLGLAMLMALVLLSAGCSGINAGASVSPASFFLPGLLKADSPQTNAPVSFPETSKEFAQAE